MPNLLTLPRELRDEIYAWILRDAQPPPARSRRRRVAHNDGDGDDATVLGDSRVRYPVHGGPAATGALLRSCRQVRAELLAVAGRAPLRYKVHLGVSGDADVLYPTWVAVPLVAGRVDVLEVEVRLRGRRAAAGGSLRSFDGGGRDTADDDDDGGADVGAGNVVVAGLALLRRFVERGVDFLGAKRAEAVAVGLLALNMTLPRDGAAALGAAPAAFGDEVADGLEAWLRGDDCVYGDTRADRAREDEQLCFLAGRVARFSLAIAGNTRRVWDVRATTAAREARRRARGDGERGPL
jgi:hypothetical protein